MGREGQEIGWRRDQIMSCPDSPGASRGAAARSAAARTTTGHAVAVTHPAKINEAYADGGPKLTVRTVEQLTGVHIDHYLEVDFVSFMKTVDVLGGVRRGRFGQDLLGLIH